MRHLLLTAAATLALASCNVVELSEPLDPPRRVRAVAGIGSVTVFWEDTGAEAYALYHAPEATVGPTTWESLGGERIVVARPPHTVSGLAPGQIRYFAVSALRGEDEAAPATSLSATPLPGPLVQATPAWSYEGASSETLGRSAAIGDLDGDGRDDLVVGSPFQDTNEGVLYVFYGRDALPATPDLPAIVGAAGDYLSVAVTVADANADGYGDLFFGEPGASATQRGHVHLRYGSPTGLVGDVVFEGADGQMIGESVATGDVDGDGDLDLLIGTFGIDDGANSSARLHLGTPAGYAMTPDWILEGETSNDGTGHAVTIADLDGDGYDDLVVGEPRRASVGRVRVFRGGLALPSETADATFDGQLSGAAFGGFLVNAGDVDGDGAEEILVGEQRVTPGAPRVHLVNLARGSLAVQSGASGPVGARLSAAAGDVDEDGFSDVVIGDPLAGGGNGSVSLHLGGPLGVATNAAWTRTGTALEELGTVVAIAGDVDGDGLAEILAGAPRAASNDGRVYLWRAQPSRGVVVDAGQPIVDIDGANGTPTGAAFSDPVAAGPWTCEWEWFTGQTPIVITPCTEDNVENAPHFADMEEDVGWARLRVRHEDGRYGEAITPMFRGAR